MSCHVDSQVSKKKEFCHLFDSISTAVCPTNKLNQHNIRVFCFDTLFTKIRKRKNFQLGDRWWRFISSSRFVFSTVASILETGWKRLGVFLVRLTASQHGREGTWKRIRTHHHTAKHTHTHTHKTKKCILFIFLKRKIYPTDRKRLG